MILGFKTQNKGVPTGFVEKIMAGIKIHTLREDGSNRWRAGVPIQFATGVGTKSYNHFKDGRCTGVQHIRITHWEDGLLTGFRVFVDGDQLTDDQIEQLATNDGFAARTGFYDWFNKDFEGKIIHWTDVRY